MSEINNLSKTIAMINSTYPSLTKAEKKVADVILEETEKITNTSITDLAQKADIGDTTVLRFCRKIGFRSYQAFKMTLAKEIAISKNSNFIQLNEEINENDSVENIIQKTLQTNINVLNETCALVNKDNIEKAAELLINAESIHFYGISNSGIIAQDACNRFLRIGLKVSAYVDLHMQIMDASLLTEKDVVVGISFSGSSMDTCETMKTAKEAGASTICITHYANSPVTKLGDVVLLSGGTEGLLRGSTVSAKIAQLYIIDILYSIIFHRNKDKAITSKEKTVNSVTERHY